MTTVTLAEAGENFPRYVDRVRRHHDRVVLTDHNQPAVVLISAEDLEGLQETVEVLSDSEAVQALLEAPGYGER